jgi:hypothetical protein
MNSGNYHDIRRNICQGENASIQKRHARNPFEPLSQPLQVRKSIGEEGTNPFTGGITPGFH